MFIIAIAATAGIPPNTLVHILQIFTGIPMPVVSDVKCTASSVPTPDITQNRKDLKKPHFTITTKTATTEASTKKPIINKKGIFILSPLKHMRQAPGICTKKEFAPIQRVVVANSFTSVNRMRCVQKQYRILKCVMCVV